MKAIRVSEYGGPSVLKIEEVPTPQPGPNQVLVRNHAVGVNPVDTYLRSNTDNRGPKLPYTPGADCGGGRGGGRGRRHGREGRRPRLRGRHASPAPTPSCALCEQAQVHPLPANASFAQGAAMNVPYATAYHALFNRGHGEAGETVLVHGASGGVGIGAVQLARARGLTVIGTAGTERGRRLVLEQGAHHVLDHTAPGYLDELMRLTGGQGVDVVLEMLANVNLQKDLGHHRHARTHRRHRQPRHDGDQCAAGHEQGRGHPRHGALPRHAGAARRHPRRPRGGARATGRCARSSARSSRSPQARARPRGGDGSRAPRQDRPGPVAGGQKRPICFAGALGRTLNVARSRSPGCPYSLASPPAAARPARVRLACDLRAPPRRLDLFEPPAVRSSRESFYTVEETGDTNVNDTRRISGVLSPVVTPFKADLSPDPERFVRQCRWLLSQNVGPRRLRDELGGELAVGGRADRAARPAGRRGRRSRRA